MNISTRLLSFDVLGFFELDDRGVIRYSSTARLSPAGAHSVIGQNFFEQDGFRNRDELRRLFRHFLESREAADSFPFDCFYDNSVLHTRITLTRAFETGLSPAERIVMVSIREVRAD